MRAFLVQTLVAALTCLIAAGFGLGEQTGLTVD
jgi:hypothetical protein